MTTNTNYFEDPINCPHNLCGKCDISDDIDECDTNMCPFKEKEHDFDIPVNWKKEYKSLKYLFESQKLHLDNTIQRYDIQIKEMEEYISQLKDKLIVLLLREEDE